MILNKLNDSNELNNSNKLSWRQAPLMLKVFFYRSGPKARQPALAFHSNKLNSSTQLNNPKKLNSSKQLNDSNKFNNSTQLNMLNKLNNSSKLK